MSSSMHADIHPRSKALQKQITMRNTIK